MAKATKGKKVISKNNSKDNIQQFILAMIAVVAVVALVGMVTLVMNQRSAGIVQPTVEQAAPVGEVYYQLEDGTMVPEDELDENMLGNVELMVVIPILG